MKIILLIFFLLLSFSFANDRELEAIFKKSNINGTLVLSSLDNEKNYIYNTKRALTQYIPASTFKIPNTLIALQEQVIKDEYETIKWDGVV